MIKRLVQTPYRKLMIIAAIAVLSVSVETVSIQTVFSRATHEVNYGLRDIQGPVLLVNRIHDYTNSDFRGVSLQLLTQYPTLVAAIKQADANFEAAQRPCYPGSACNNLGYWGPPPTPTSYRVGIPTQEATGIITPLDMHSFAGEESQDRLSSEHASNIKIDGKFYAIMISPN